MVRDASLTVSVIIPAFNQATYLGQAIDSVLAQTWRDLEVIVVNDGSTDDTDAVLQAAVHGDARVRAITQDNAGVAAARNRGLAEARGELVCFLDADDWYAPEKVADQVAQFQREPSLDWVYCDVVLVDAAGAPAGDFTVAGARTVLSGDILDSLIIGGYFPPHTVMARRRVVEAAGGFAHDLGGNADYDLWLRLAAADHRVEFLPERHAFYRQHDAAMSRDPQHMRDSRTAALGRVARLAPARVAAAIVALQALNEELHAANQWLGQQWQPALRRLAGDEGRDRYSFVEAIGRAHRLEGPAEHAAVWDVTVDDETDRALFLHAPAALEFELPVTADARLQTAVALHPDVWTKTDGGPCDFEVLIDGAVAFAMRIDPVSVPEHRRWHPLTIPVPAAAAPHRITFRTACKGRNYFRWALWRNPVLTWAAA